MNNADMPAMPIFDENAKPCIVRDLDSSDKKEVPATGLTKREMMAMHMMASLTSTYWDTLGEYRDGKHLVACQAETAVEMADALLDELEK